MHGQITKAAPERLLVFCRDVLIPENNYLMFDKGGFDGIECFIIEWLGQIHITDFCTAGRSHPKNLNVLVSVRAINDRFTHDALPHPMRPRA